MMRIPKFMIAIWIGGTILSLSLIGFGIWVVIKLLQHFKVI